MRQAHPVLQRGRVRLPRAKLVIGDAKAGLEAEPDGSIDVIICDLSDPLDGGPCYQLYTTSFYEMCKSKLAPGGILVTQSGCAAVRDCKAVFTPINKTLREVFPQVWGYTVCVPSFCSEWGFNIATKDADHVDLYTGITANGELDKRLAARGLGALSYYDGITHTRMFSLNRTVRGGVRAGDSRDDGGEPAVHVLHGHARGRVRAGEVTTARATRTNGAGAIGSRGGIETFTIDGRRDATRARSSEGGQNVCRRIKAGVARVSLTGQLYYFGLTSADPSGNRPRASSRSLI